MDSPEAQRGIRTTIAELSALAHHTHGFSLLPRQPVHSLLAGRHASRLRGRGLNFEEIRRYQPGDDIRLIDWKVTVRTRKTHSRVYTEERERTVLLLVDQRTSMFFGSVREMKSVTAAKAAALAAWRVLLQQDRVGAVVFGDSDLADIRPQRSRATVLRILGEVARRNQSLTATQPPVESAGMFNVALARAAELAKHDCLVVVISDGGGTDDESHRLLTRIASHNDVLFVFVFDPLEAALPDAGPLVFSDGDRELAVDTADDRLRNRFADEFARHRETGRKFLRQRETPVLALSTAEDLAAQVRRQLGGTR